MSAQVVVMTETQAEKVVPGYEVIRLPEKEAARLRRAGKKIKEKEEQ